MKKFFPALLAGLLLASAATADIAPPPPPKGKKYAAVNNEVVLDKGVSGYVFVQQTSTGPGRPQFTFEKIELAPGKAKALPAGGRRSSVSLYAVPEKVAKEYKTDDKLFDALKANKVKGAHRLGFTSTATVPDKIKGDSVRWTTTVTEIDARSGFKTKVEGEGYEPKASPKRERPGAPPGTLAAGIAATLGVLLGGFWLAGRARRKL